jgi:superfamily II RNA helicase
MNVDEVLKRVGDVAPEPFAPAAFQSEALQAIEHGDVIVSAPTGSGKTWIAEQEIARLLRRTGSRVAHAGTGTPADIPAVAGLRHRDLRPGLIWYTAPLKALSNQKFRRFQDMYGAERVGLLTGERKVNAGAPVLVATTEILRNVLYDARPGETPEVAVLDEAHYLADPERGTAWEEIILLAPRATRLLLLSATIPNAADLAAWMGTVRSREPRVITLANRPVPLAFLLADGTGRLLPPDPRRVRRHRRQPRWLAAAAGALHDGRLVPAILFFPSRRECDEAARLLGAHPAPGEAERAERLRRWIARVPQLEGHPHLPALRRGGVAPHHAGHLTAWRMCVEELLDAGLVWLVCATTTLAAGLDVPARTVLLSTLDRHGPRGPEPLTPTEFQQMTGRAGRRGRDRLGVVVIKVEAPEDAEEALALSEAAPDPVRSAFAPSDTQALNMLMRATAGDVETLLRRSFASFLRAPEIAELRAEIASLPQDPLTDRPCGDRLTTRGRFDALLRRLRQARRRKGETSGNVASIGREIVEMPCTGCPVVGRCLESLADLADVERRRRGLATTLAGIEDREVAEFQRRAGILCDLGYLDAGWRPTAQGRRAARIRHPRMLVLAEALRTGIFPVDPPALAALAGALGTERISIPRAGVRPGSQRAIRRVHADGWASPRAWQDALPQRARAAILGLKRLVVRINAVRQAAGLEADPLEDEFTAGDEGPPALGRAAAVAAWAQGRDWNTVTRQYGIPEGDLQRLIWQAAEILAQLEDLPGEPVASPARAAREALLRPPVE